ncbi:MAG: chemotaxis protein CheD [Methylocystaceae bacterium]|nr:MAG: chemotaxis protein CheD [Methylocystaceae bacterium]
MTQMTDCLKRIHIIQGEYRVVDDPDTVLATVLGSCVAACLRDAEAGVGGMNHFLLPGDLAASRNGEAERYGAHLMELLVNGLLKKGARRERLEGKLFGGARMMEGLSDIGAKNAEFAKRFLRNEGIRIVAENLGGARGRRVEYSPVSGRARQSLLSDQTAAPPPLPISIPKLATAGAVELF